MKLILSRKGFDTSSGGCPSPIFEDGTMFSLPIPVAGAPIRYEDIRGNDSVKTFGDIVEDLSRRRIKRTDAAHLDPDLSYGSQPRKAGWRPLFGQVSGPQTHLEKHGVGKNDIFLFFGLFRPVERAGGVWRYLRGSNPMHVIFGWMEVAECWPVREFPLEATWAHYHPHFDETFKNVKRNSHNVVYVAKQSCSLTRPELPTLGGGVFTHFSERRRLSKLNSQSWSYWTLPSWFYPTTDSSLSHNGKLANWQKTATGVELDSAKRGQEFVLNCDHYPQAVDWVKNLLTS